MLTNMMESRCTVGIAKVGTQIHEKNLAEEMMELRKLQTAVMMEKCLSKNEAVVCPKPRRWHVRQSGEHNDLKLAAELSDILMSKASPPYYGSPPIRASNPLIQDAHFQERASQNPLWDICVEGLGVNRKRRIRSVLTKA